MIHGLRPIHLVEVGHPLNGKEYQFVIGRPSLFWQLAIELQGIGLEAGKIATDAVPLACSQIVGTGVQHLSRHTTIVFCTQIEQTGRLDGVFTAYDSLTERLGMLLHQLSPIQPLRVPGHIQEELNLILHRLQVTHVQHPKAVQPVVGSQSQLLPHALCLGHIHPLAVARVAHIIHMIVQSPTSGMLALLSIGHAADIAPVVVAEQDGDIVRHTHTLVVILQHLFI